MTEPEAPFRLRITGTLVAQHFASRCDRRLRYELVPPQWRGGDVPADNRDPERGPIVAPRPGMGLLLERGRRWERRVIDRLVRRHGDAVVHGGVDERGSYAALPTDRAVEVLRHPQGVRFLVQPSLSVADGAAFAARLGLDPAVVEIAPAQPDLLRIARGRGGRVRLQVADVKWSREGTIRHFAQVAFYTLVLEELVARAGLDVDVETRRGWIWPRGARGPRPFALAAYRHHVLDLLRRDLPAVAAGAPPAARWHLGEGCAGCPWLRHCRAESDAADDPARVVGVTPLAKEALAAKGVRTAAAIGKALRKDVFTGSHALEAGEKALKQRSLALAHRKVYDVAAETQRMGAGEGARVLLTAEADPVTGTVFAMGARVEGMGRPADAVFLTWAGTRAAEGEALAPLLVRLGAVAEAAAASAEAAFAAEAGQRRRRSAPPPLHLYLWDRAALEAFRDLLQRHVGEPALGRPIAALMRLLAPAGESGPGGSAPAAPFTVLADVVSELYALPVPYVYDLAGVSSTLTPSTDAAPWRPPAAYRWTFSSAVAFERAHDHWRGKGRKTRGGEETAEEVEASLRAAVSGKLAAIDSVVRAVREREERRRESRLRMEGGWTPAAAEEPIRDPALETLRVFVRAEAAAEAAQLRALHALSARDRARRFECIRGMELVERREDGAMVFEFDSECRDAKFREGEFNLVLTNEDTDGLREADRSPWRRRKLLVELSEYDLSASPPRVVLAPSDRKGFAKALDEGLVYLDRVCVLDRAPADFNTRRLVATLRALDEGRGEAAFVRGLLAGDVPDGWTAPLDVEGTWNAVMAPLSARLGRDVLNPEQRDAWRAVLRDAATVIWGPPGTGKTYLLAWILVGLAAEARRAGRPLRVLVTSATHRAVVNVLSRLAKEVAATGVEVPMRLLKLKGSGNPADAELDALDVEVVEDDRLEGALAAASSAGDAVIVGSTVWSLWKRMKAAGRGAGEDDEGGDAPVRPWFDVVVIDEASQVKVPEALIALSSIRPGGRVVLCGDDRQLAPVLRGRYGAEGGTLLGSAFAHFAALFGRVSLRESRRMNAALVRYPREIFYPGLVSRVPAARLRAEAPAGGWGDALDDLLWETFFDPEGAVVLLTYSGVRATARNPFEAALAARIARLARDGLRDADGAPLSTERFVSQALAVLSPHRAQNGAILAELAAAGFARGTTPVVDTVERMQGNERDMIVVSYSVADVEYAEAEAEFLLDPNRFNVSITRPRAKLVVLMSDAVLRALPRDEEVMTGSMAIKGYAAHCSDAVRDVVLPGPDGEPVRAVVRVRRLPAREGAAA